MASRIGLRFLNTYRQNLSKSFPFRSTFQRRAYADASTATTASAPAGYPEQSKFQQFWNSKVGPKTVHFWAPVMKWGLVIAGAADFARPAEKLSLSQNAALSCTGLIWTRWCCIIKPRNLFLASVNFLVACVGLTQVTRIMLYRRSLGNDSIAAEASKAAEEEGAIAQSIIKDPKAAVNQAKKDL